MSGCVVGGVVMPLSLTLRPVRLRHDSCMAPARVSVVVADDHPLFREGIERAVRERPELELVGAAADGRDALPTRALIVSASGDPEVVYRAVQAGAAGYFRKEADRDAILNGIAAVAGGRTAIEPELQAGVFDQIRLRGTGEERPILTAREREVLALLAEGLSGPQIAERLIVALPTVKTHQARLYDKLGVSDRAAAVAEAMRRGLLE